MSVLPGEGTVPILFSRIRVAVGPRIHDAYLARPDLSGAWPTVIALADAPGASIRAFSRRLARHGLAVVVAPGRSARVVADVSSFIVNPAADWSSAEDGFGLLGIEDATVLQHAGRAEAVGLIGAPFTTPVAVPGPVLALYGQDDPARDTVDELRASLPQAEVVLYRGVGAGFHDDAADGFDHVAATDAVERLVEFFTKALPPGPAV